MRKLPAIIGALAGATLGIITPPHIIFDHQAAAHDVTHPGSTPATIPVEHANAGTVNPEHAQPAYATNCQHYIRSSRTSAYGMCYNWSGSGSYKFQVAALGVDACGRRMWFYGSVGQVYVPGKTTYGRESLVYSPGGTWRFYASQIIAWKP